jgi:hypothetical protein
MSPQRARMIEDMILAGLARGTQQCRAVANGVCFNLGANPPFATATSEREAIQCRHGLMNEYIKACRDAHARGIDFTQCTKHAGHDLPMASYQVKLCK